MTVSARRSTRQRSAVSEFLADQDGFRSAQDIHAQLRAVGHPIGLATVYRALQTMAEDGEVDVLRTDDGEAVYRRCSPSHHHHLVCRRCGRTIEVQDRPVARWADRIGAEHGFVDIEHTVEVYGTCGACHGSEG
jgi:Fur family ferric uptake transcriptional regulator